MAANKKPINYEPSSFRDPSGVIYYQDNTVFRQVNPSFQPHLDTLFTSGLFDTLTQEGMLLPHTRLKKPQLPGAYATFRTEKLPFISYPYEWTFSQLKDAALLTLTLQKTALEHGMTLKDASAYNVQFLNDKAVFIDLLSFEIYESGKPWVAYRQFCQHFLGPLLLMSLVDIRLAQLLRVYIDGIPLDLVSKLLPKHTYLSLPIASHIHLHARNQQKFAAARDKAPTQSLGLSKLAQLGIIDSLQTLIQSLTYGDKNTEWGEYYTFTNYSDEAFLNKKRLVEKYLERIKPQTVWDIGANTGEFSRVASQKGIFTVSSDLDPVAVEKNYLYVKHHQQKNLLPLIIDLTNPSPALGWANIERASLIERGPADLVMALALIHHMAISNNVPFTQIAEFCRRIGKALIIEFVPKSDSQVQKLLATRQDIFDSYSQENFEQQFSNFFKIVEKTAIPESQRTLYLMTAK